MIEYGSLKLICPKCGTKREYTPNNSKNRTKYKSRAKCFNCGKSFLVKSNVERL